MVLVAYTFYWVRSIVIARRTLERSPAAEFRLPTPFQSLVGFVVCFFDALGIGMYAPTTAIFKISKMLDDRLIPGTLTVGSAIGGILETFFVVALINVDPTTLLLMIAAATLGAWLGAGVVAKLPRRTIQLGMGCALVIAATLMLLTQMHLMPGGGNAIGIRGAALVFAVMVNFVLGALMTLGIGMYAPSMIMVSLLGMNPKAAFPIMIGSCAFLVPVAAVRFIRERSYAMRPSLGLMLGGIPGGLIALFLVREIPLVYVRWVVIVVVLYAASSMLSSALKSTHGVTIPEEAQTARSSSG